MRAIDPRTLLVADGAGGRVVRLTIDGKNAVAETLASGLRGPTSVVRVGKSLWVSEAQFGVTPQLPFRIERVELSSP